MKDQNKLSKTLKLYDVYAICTGAMFSSGFFLLPGLAAMQTGPSVYLAYLLAGFLILPAMLSMAELSTAMPKSGGAYYFLDRSMGPLLGTIGGLGSWVALIFKSAFALVGMGAYLAIFIDVPITILAVALTLIFGVVNVFGAKETTLLQRVLVTTLVVIMGYFCLQGLSEIGITAPFTIPEGEDKFFKGGFAGFISTIGLVFVSFAGLTKVASVSEEVQNPDRNIPLGMLLSLVTAIAIYVIGVLIMVHVLPPDDFYQSLTPVADASAVFFDWLPGNLGLVLIVIAAIAAFASTGNAGILSASRYPFAMGKDQLLSPRFSTLGKHQTPAFSIGVTTLIMAAILILFDIQAVAKLASAFQLLLFALLNLAVIVMRESKIETYRPGFYSPFYPWPQIAGVFISFWLIVEMGGLAIAFTGFLSIFCAIWYYFYAFGRVKREGAIYHVHARLGKRQFEGLEHELMSIVHERDHESLAYEGIIGRSAIIDCRDETPGLQDLLKQASGEFAKRLEMKGDEIFNRFASIGHSGYKALGNGVFLNDTSFEGIEQPEMVIFRVCKKNPLTINANLGHVDVLIYLVLPTGITGLDLRLAGHIAEIVQSEDFSKRWFDAADEKALREVLVSDNHLLHAEVGDIALLQSYVGQEISQIELPGEAIIALIEREDRLIIAGSKEKLHENDKVVIIGEPSDLKKLKSV